MNDFTKEELEYILLCIETDIKYFGADHVGHAARDKLKYRLENYCEHEEGFPELSLTKECVKCNKYMDHKLWGNHE